MVIRVYHADDHADFSIKLREILEPHVKWVGASTSGDTVMGEVAALEPEVVLLDISMPGKSGLELTREMRVTMSDVKIIIVTMHADKVYLEAALAAGASGYVLKSRAASEIVDAIEEVHRGGTFISRALSS